MMSNEEIIEYCNNYKVINGKVINKNTNQEVTEINTILKVKSAILIYKEAHDSYKSDIQQFGKTNRSQRDYISKTMEKFGVNGEKNSYGTNKLVNAILSSSGHYEEMMSGANLNESKFSILVGPKKDYGVAYLRLMFRNQGLDIENLQVKQDLTELKHNGVSKVMIDFKLNKMTKNTANNQANTTSFSHPKAADLNYLEEQKRIAKQNNDHEAYNYAVKNIEKIVRENPITVSQEQWNTMSQNQRIDYIKLKLNESKVLGDRDAFNYWNSNLKTIQNNPIASNDESKAEESKVQSDKMDEKSKENNSTNKEESKEKDYKYYYQKLMSAVEKRRKLSNPSEEEKKQVVGEIFYYEGYLVEKLNTDKEIMEIVNSVLNDLSITEPDKKLGDIILADMQERWNKIERKKINNHDKSPIREKKETSRSEQSDLLIQINNLRKDLEKISKEYHQMLSDGYIDDEELATLIKRIKVLEEDTYVIKPLASTTDEKKLLNSIIEMLNKEQKKMIQMQRGIQNIANTF